MRIYSSSSTGPIRPDTTSGTSQPANGNDAQGAGSVQSVPSTSTDRSDKVQISDAGRALAARDGGAASGTTGMDPAQASQIRGRVLSGAYDTLEVVDAVARRLLDSGDL